MSHCLFPSCSTRDKVLHAVFTVAIAVMVACAAVTILCFKQVVVNILYYSYIKKSWPRNLSVNLIMKKIYPFIISRDAGSMNKLFAWPPGACIGGPVSPLLGFYRIFNLQHPLQHLNGHPSMYFLINFGDLAGTGVFQHGIAV